MKLVLVKAILYKDNDTSKDYMVHSIVPFSPQRDTQLLYPIFNDFGLSPVINIGSMENIPFEMLYDFQDTFNVSYRRENNFTPAVIGVAISPDFIHLFKGAHKIFRVLNFRMKGSK